MKAETLGQYLGFCEIVLRFHGIKQVVSSEDNTDQSAVRYDFNLSEIDRELAFGRELTLKPNSKAMVILGINKKNVMTYRAMMMSRYSGQAQPDCLDLYHWKPEEAWVIVDNKLL